MAETLATRLADLVEVLRRAGIPVGSGEVLLAASAAELVGIERPVDLREALATTLLHRREDRAVFDAAFQVVMLAAPNDGDDSVAVPGPRTRAAREKRLAAALSRAGSTAPEGESRELAEVASASDEERLSHRDFEQMSPAEAHTARRLVREAARWWQRPVRRWRPDVSGARVDPRRSLRALAHRPDAALPEWRSQRQRRLRLVLICDVSASMHTYARAFLQLAHALGGRDRSVELFAFATRLTRLTPLLRIPESDVALTRMGAAVRDWDSGTRIGAALDELLRDHRSRMLGSNTLVVLLSDGLERGDLDRLRRAAARLRLSCRAVLWINPLLRYAGYEPLAAGAGVLVEEFGGVRPAHDPASLAALVRSLSAMN